MLTVFAQGHTFGSPMLKVGAATVGCASHSYTRTLAGLLHARAVRVCIQSGALLASMFAPANALTVRVGPAWPDGRHGRWRGHAGACGGSARCHVQSRVAECAPRAGAGPVSSRFVCVCVCLCRVCPADAGPRAVPDPDAPDTLALNPEKPDFALAKDVVSTISVSSLTFHEASNALAAKPTHRLALPLLSWIVASNRSYLVKLTPDKQLSCMGRCDARVGGCVVVVVD